MSTLHLYGRHNISNAWPPPSAAYVLGLPGEAVERGLESFTGAGRRFEHKGTYHGAEVYDDYAHHPDELHALLTTAKGLGYQRLVVAFQPHTYTRTYKLFDRFVEELKLADLAVVAESTPPGNRTPWVSSLRGFYANKSRLSLLLHPGSGGRPAPGDRPARGSDPHRGRRGHLPGGREAAGGGGLTCGVSEVYTAAPAGDRAPVELETFARLDRLGISYTWVSHDPANTIEDCADVDAGPGRPAVQESLPVQPAETEFYLLAMPGDKPFQTKVLSHQLGTARLSFAPPELMEGFIRLRPRLRQRAGNGL